MLGYGQPCIASRPGDRNESIDQCAQLLQCLPTVDDSDRSTCRCRQGSIAYKMTPTKTVCFELGEFNVPIYLLSYLIKIFTILQLSSGASVTLPDNVKLAIRTQCASTMFRLVVKYANVLVATKAVCGSNRKREWNSIAKQLKLTSKAETTKGE